MCLNDYIRQHSNTKYRNINAGTDIRPSNFVPFFNFFKVVTISTLKTQITFAWYVKKCCFTIIEYLIPMKAITF